MVGKTLHPWLPNARIWESEKEFSQRLVERLMSIVPRELVEKARESYSSLPDRIDEPWVLERRLMSIIGGRIRAYEHVFAGGIVCPHYVHPVVEYLISRGEYLTSYTPYQPEISQGVLQALYEYQSLIAELFEVEVVNSGMYDGATALAEAIGIALRVNKGKSVLLPLNMNSRIENVLKTYSKAFEFSIKRYDPLDPDSVCENRDDKVAAVVVDNPLSNGTINANTKELYDKAHEIGALAISFTDPLLASVTKPPGKEGADIVVGEGQSLGLPMNGGGPLLGILGVRDDGKLLRNLPGRLVGKTLDRSGRRAYALILQTREQHIRREKATSNITTNTALNAIGAAISLSLMGKEGIRSVAWRVLANTSILMEELGKIQALYIRTRKPAFKNVMYSIKTLKERISLLRLFKYIHGAHGIIPFSLEQENVLLSCATEVHSRYDLEKFARILAKGISLVTQGGSHEV